MCKASVSVRKPGIQARRIERKAFRRQRSGQKRTCVRQQQRTQRQRALAGKENAGTLADHLHIRALSGAEADGNGALAQLHGQGWIGWKRRGIADEQKDRHMLRVGR